jgi:hypothetical protein
MEALSEFNSKGGGRESKTRGTKGERKEEIGTSET